MKCYILVYLLSTSIAVAVAFHIPDLVFPFWKEDTTSDFGVTFYFLPSGSQLNEGTKGVVINNVTKDTAGGLFDKSKETKLVIHGWHSSCDVSFGLKMSKALRDTKRYNVICIDWSKESLEPYPIARWDVAEVGEIVASFLDRLSEAGVDPGKSHIIAHSLGAHIAGIAGFNAKKKIARITGLDPAGPFFMAIEKNVLKKESADFVDVIHTCAHYKGLISPLGHADFYPNNGEHSQPGCGPDFSGDCSHGRSYAYYMESIETPGSFLSMRCEDWNSFENGSCKGELSEMGENVDRSARGLYYLYTAEKVPFGLGKESVTPKPVN